MKTIIKQTYYHFMTGVLVLTISVLTIIIFARVATAATATFQVSDYRSSGNIVNNITSQYWRGYLFSVTENTTITKLVGGGGTGFQVSIYNVTSVTNGGNTVTPGSSIGYATNVTGAVNEVLNISGGNADSGNAIYLEKDTPYLLASGRTNSGSGNHWTVGDINVDNILLSPRIASWGPNVLDPIGKTFYWSNPVSHEQNYAWLVGKANNTVTGSTIPALGFQYTIPDTDPAEVTTLAPTFNGSVARMNGRIDTTGGGATTMAIIYGQNSSLSSGNTTEIIGTTDADEDGTVPFYFEKDNLAAGTWYYQARGENDSGAVLGDIISFTVYNLNYGVANETCHVTSVGGTIAGTTNQKSYSYDADGVGGNDPIYSLGTAVTAIPDTGFAFVKWCDNDSTNPARTDNGEGSGVDAYAQFAPELTFNSHGGSSVNPIVEFEGNDITIPAAPTRAGYTFVGWNTEADGTGETYQAGADISMPEVGFMLHAIWVDSTDLNNDGTSDVLQNNVASFINPVNDNYVSITLSDEECTFNEASSATESDSTKQDIGYNYPVGLINFSADCSSPTVTVSLHYYGVEKEGLIVRKYNPHTETYTTILTASLSQTVITGQTVSVATYQVTDGGELDTDGEVNGTIVDPVGLASAISATSSGSSDLATTGYSQLLYMLASILLLVTSGLAISYLTVTYSRS